MPEEFFHNFTAQSELRSLGLNSLGESPPALLFWDPWPSFLVMPLAPSPVKAGATRGSWLPLNSLSL